MDEPFPGPCQPLRFEDFIPVYTSDQIEIYGLPDHWGVFYYIIIETRESAHPQVVDYTLTCERRGSLRPIHRYSRIERFESVLYQLIGARGKVPKRIINYIKLVGYDKQPELLWESIRAILKEKGWRLYYNRIPTILQLLGERKTINFQDQALLISEIVVDFRKLSAAFDRRPGIRKYFPNLRFIALKLLEAHGAVFEYMIPVICSKLHNTSLTLVVYPNPTQNRYHG